MADEDLSSQPPIITEQQSSIGVDDDNNVPLQHANVETPATAVAESSKALTDSVRELYIESDDEEDAAQKFLNRNFGLPYSDHDYDVVDKEKRAKLKEHQHFPEIGNLDDYGNPLPIQSKNPDVSLKAPHKQYYHHGPDYPRTVPAIVARAPALRDGNVYRVAAPPQQQTPEASFAAAGAQRTPVQAYPPQTAMKGNGSAMRVRGVDPAQGGSYSVQHRTHSIHHQMVQASLGDVAPSPATPAARAVLATGRGRSVGQPQQQQLIPPNQTTRRMNVVRATPAVAAAAAAASSRTAVLRTYQKDDEHPHHQHLPPPPPTSGIPPPQQRELMAPHRMTLEQRQKQQKMVMANRTMTSSSSYAQQQHGGEAPPERGVGIAPMLVTGRSVQVRGRTGSSGMVRRDMDRSPPPRHIVNLHQQQRAAELSTSATPGTSLDDYQQHPQQQLVQNNHHHPQQQLLHKDVPMSPRKIPLATSDTTTSYSTPAASAVAVDQQLPAQLTEDPTQQPPTTPSKSTAAAGEAMPLKMTPPHRRSLEQRNVLIQKHIDKEKHPLAGGAGGGSAAVARVLSNIAEAEQQVASVVADVTAAATAAAVPNPATSHMMTSQSTTTTSIQGGVTTTNNLTSKEKFEISRLANDLKQSAEQADYHQKQRMHQQQHGYNSSMMRGNGKEWKSNDMNAAQIQNTIDTIQKQLDQEKVANMLGGGKTPPQEKRRSMGKPSPQQQHQHEMMQHQGPPPPPQMTTASAATVAAARQAVVAGMSYQPIVGEIQPQRHRGRPKGSLNRSTVEGGTPKARTLVPVKETKRAGGGKVKMIPSIVGGAENQRPKAEKQQQQQQQRSNENSDSESEGVGKNDEYGDDWEMRCRCEMSHGSGACIECGNCKTWQHTLCMGLIPNQEPEVYLCEKCEPRHVTPSKAEAIRIQNAELKKLAKLAAAAAKRGRKSGSGAGGGKSTPASAAATTKQQGSKRLSISQHQQQHQQKHPYTDYNDYSRAAMKFLKSLGPTEHATSVLADAKTKNQSKKMYVTEVHEGIVTTNPIIGREVITELNGYICLPDECDRQHGGKKFTFQYDGLLKGPRGEHILDPETNQMLCIDARKNRDNDAKYVRRSCNPNSVLKHVLDDRGVLGVMIVSLNDIPYNTEITLPFDNDFRMCPQPLECAEHFENGMHGCPCERERDMWHQAEKERLERLERQRATELAAAASAAPAVEGEKMTRKRSSTGLSNGKSEAPKKEVDDNNGLEEEQEEEEEEEVQAKKRKGRPSRGVAAPVTAKEVKEEAPLSPKKEEPATPVKSVERPRQLTREEKRAQQYEDMFKKQAELEKRKKKNKETKKEKEGATSPPPPPAVVPEKRQSARVAKTSISSSTSLDTSTPAEQPTREPSTRSLRKKRESEADAKPSTSATPAAPAVSTKRLRGEAAREAAAAAAAAILKAEPIQEETTTTKVGGSPMLGKKHWMQRHNAETKHAAVDTSGPSPTKKTRKSSLNNDETAVKLTVGEVWSRMRDNAKLATSREDVADFDTKWLTKDDKPSRRVKEVKKQHQQQQQQQQQQQKEKEEAAEVAEVAEIKKEEPSEGEEVEISPLPVVKKEQKRISLTEYQKRRNTTTGGGGGASEEAGVHKTGKGFIPSTEGTSNQSLTLPMISLEETTRLNQLKERILGGTTTAGSSSSGEMMFTPAASAAGGAEPSSSSESPRHHSMSLRDRIDSEFGFLKGQADIVTAATSPPPPPPPPAQQRRDEKSPTRRSRVSRWQ